MLQVKKKKNDTHTTPPSDSGITLCFPHYVHTAFNLSKKIIKAQFGS